MPGGGPNGANGTGGPGGGNGGNSGGAAQVGASAAQNTLIFLRLARYAAAKPIWLSYLPEVPPA
jgi:GTPase involved in cell partitioning and DNA repair